MSTPLPRVLAGVAVAGLILAGCSTTPVQVRIAEVRPDFVRLPSVDQRRVRNGGVNEGDTPEMVYVALGSPHQIDVSADGAEVTWSYRRIYPTEAMHAGPLYRAPSIQGFGGHAARAWGGGGGGPDMPRPSAPDAGNIAPDIPLVDVTIHFRDGRADRVEIVPERT